MVVVATKPNLGWETLKKMKKLAAFHIFAGATASGAFFLSNSFFVDKWRPIYEAVESGFPSPLDKEINDCFSEVMNDMKLEDETKDKIKPFKTHRLSLWHAGYSKFNTLIAIPKNFEYKDPYQAIRAATMWQNPVDWHTADGEKLRETLVLNKNEKKFAIAREIYEARSLKNYIFPFIPLSLSAISFSLLHRLKTKYTKLIEHSKWRKRGIYGLVYFFAYVSYFVAKDSTQLSIEYEADELVSKIGFENDMPTDLTFDYIKGGIEYYNKMLIRNQIIKNVYMPNYAKWMVKEDGDLSQYFRHKHASIVIRKKELEEMLVNFEKYGKLFLYDVTPDEREKKIQEEQETLAAASDQLKNANIVNVS